MSDNEVAEVEFVKQSNLISRSAYMMPASCRKIIFYAMAQSSFHEEGFEVIEVSAADIVSSVGIPKGGETYKILKEMSRDAKSQTFTIEDENGYEHFSWLSKCQYVKSRDVFKMKLDDSLFQYVVDMKSHFSFIPLESVGKLQGKYAIRLFELVLSQSGHEGRNGNEEGEWFYCETIEKLRYMFKIPQNKYKLTAEFRRWCIDKPIAEINEAHIGLHITPEYIKKGRSLKSVRLRVRRIQGDSPIPVSPVTESDKEIDEVKAKYPTLFQKYYEEELSQNTLDFVPEDIKKGSAEAAAVERILKEKKGKKK